MDTPVTGTPRVLLRLEGLAALAGAVLAYDAFYASWPRFALLLLLPDVALVGYLAGPRVGSLAYNASHTYLAPALLGVFAYVSVLPGAWPICLIWVAHIGMDRMLGFGLKFATAFKDTHLGVVGRVAATS